MNIFSMPAGKYQKIQNQKQAIALKEGRKIYFTNNGEITLDPKDATGKSNFCIHKGKFALKYDEPHKDSVNYALV